MIVPLALVGFGMITPYVIRRLHGSVPAPLVIGAHTASLTLAWIGVLDLAVAGAGLAHSLAAFCEMALDDRPLGGDVRAVMLPIAVGALMIGRAGYVSSRAVAATRRTRRELLRRATRERSGISLARIGSIACTVGLVRPRILVDDEMFPLLAPDQRTAVLEHERSHAKGRHGLIDLVARSMAAGLAPLPGPRVARREIRRHLEALADDRAAARTSRRTVATTIVLSATAPPSPALGAVGGSAWRVDRLLDPPRVHPSLAGATALPIVLSVLVLAQTVSHTVAGVHLFPFAFPAL